MLRKKLGLWPLLLVCSCSHLGVENASQSVQRSPTSVNFEQRYTSSPCLLLRQSMKSDKLETDFMRCNVVLNERVDPNAKFATKGVDMCFAVSEFTDSFQQSRQRSELLGMIWSAENPETREVVKNIPVQSSRLSDEPFRKETGLAFEDSTQKYYIEDRVPFNEGWQKIEYEKGPQVLNFDVFVKENFLLGIKYKVNRLSIRVQCTNEVVYE